MKALNIFYRIGDKYYVNITNRCSCDCVFCIRRNADAVLGTETNTLWLEHEPTIDEIKSAFEGLNLDEIEEIVFCGYGESLERADDAIKVAGFIKAKTNIPLRLNTNGLVRLLNPQFDIARLEVFDCVSVSLNADNAEEYYKVTRPKFGVKSFDSMLAFASELTGYTDVAFSIVDNGEVDVERCCALADSLGIPLRVRAYEG